jgi:transcriptional regulator with XRE-family HTH domain
MDAAGIATYAELSRLTGVSQNQFSNWTRGLAQPSRDTLNRIAPALNVPRANLLLQAGITDRSDLDLQTSPDLRVLPAEFRELADLYDSDKVTDEQRLFIRRSLASLAAGVRAELMPAPSQKRRQRKT